MIIMIIQTGSSATASASSSQSRRSPPHEQPSSHSSASGYSPRSPRSGKSNSQHVTSSDASPQRPDAAAMAHSNSRNPSVRSQEFGLTEGAAAWDGSSGLTQEQGKSDDIHSFIFCLSYSPCGTSVKYCGGCSVQYFGGYSVLRRVFSTVEGF